MKLTGEAKLLRIFIGENDKHEGRPLYEVIVERARRAGLAGATVFRGLMGFGSKSHMHTAKVLRLSEDLPLLIEIVDLQARVDAFLPELDPLIPEGMITLEKVEVIAYRPGPERA